MSIIEDFVNRGRAAQAAVDKLIDNRSPLQKERDAYKAALRRIELLPLHTILMGQEPNYQCGHCIAKQVLKEQSK